VSWCPWPPASPSRASRPGSDAAAAHPHHAERPALIGAGITAAYAGPGVSEAERVRAEWVLAAAGPVVWLDDEAQMDAVTAVSGSGPAYFFLLIEAIEDAGVTLGLPRPTARRLAVQTALGSARMAAEGTDPPEMLREQVTSKGGTTAAALRCSSRRACVVFLPRPSARRRAARPSSRINSAPTETMQALYFVLDTLLKLVVCAFLLRLLLPLVRADRNPIGQAVLCFTSLVLPLRKLLRPVGRVDVASLAALVLVQLAGTAARLAAELTLAPGPLLLHGLLGLAQTALQFYFIVVLAYVILSWVAPGNYSPAAQLIGRLCEPLLRPFRRVIPPIAGLDFSAGFVLIALQALQILLR
jgi:uncharacterized protein YggT (Ycf19 family)